MEFPTLIIGPDHFGLKGSLVAFFIFFFLILIEHSIKTNSGEPDQMRRSVASDLFLHCLWMSHKKDARLKWISGKYLAMHKVLKYKCMLLVQSASYYIVLPL